MLTNYELQLPCIGCRVQFARAVLIGTAKPHFPLNSTHRHMALTTFGVVAGALSVAALFNNCVECFEYIQLGRQFGQDYERCQLKLDVVRTRLGRWGQAVDINHDARFATNTPNDQTAQLAKTHLEAIVHLFQSLEKKSKTYEITATSDDLAVLGDTNLTPRALDLHNRFGDLARRRQKRTSLVKKSKWALYEAKNFGKLVAEASDLVDDLEKLVAVENVCRNLAELEVEEMEDELSLRLLNDAASDIDATLSQVVIEKIGRIVGRNSVQDLRTEENARVRVGDEVSEVVAVRGISFAYKPTNSAGRVMATGRSRVHIGNSISGKGVFND